MPSTTLYCPHTYFRTYRYPQVTLGYEPSLTPKHLSPIYQVPSFFQALLYLSPIYLSPIYLFLPYLPTMSTTPGSATSTSSISPPTDTMTIERWINSGTKLQNVLVLSDDSNYHQWSSSAKVYLDDTDVWELVDGSEPGLDVDTHSN